jgi:DNA-binding transcriptional MerR regulator
VRIGEVAVRADVNVETLRYYERRGLLPAPGRTTGGHRDYGEEAVRFVRAVKEAQSLGFSLAEIEEYVRLSAREPSRAPGEARTRIEEKLAEVDDRIADLREQRAGLTRALYEVWDALDSSTSSAAYLARRGREPALQAGEALHVTDGESVASTLRTTSLGGVVLSWDDVLHVGPLAFEPAESRALRAAFLAGHGWGREAAVAAELARRDELLARAARERHPIVLWFEQDLFDQLQLLQVLSQLPGEDGVELVQADGYLGPLDADALDRFAETRRALTAEQVALGRDAWRAVCEDAIEPLLERDLSPLPHLESALRRLVEERAPLSRTKRQLLEALRDGPRTPLELFVANQAREEAVFLGDTWCFLFLRELAEEGLLTPLPLPPPRGDYDAFIGTTVELTSAGAAALRASARA